MKKIVVFGSFFVDLAARAPKFPVPGETVHGSSFQIGSGGKGSNQAIAAHRAGADVTFITKVGADEFGRMAREVYSREGMDTRYILVDETASTGTALIVVEESGQNMIVITSGACGRISEADIAAVTPVLEQADLLLLQLEVNFDAVKRAAALAKQSGARVILNPAPARELPDSLLSLVDIITPNESEAALLTGIPVKGPEDAKKAAAVFFEKGMQGVVITLGKQGAYVADRSRGEYLPCIPMKAVDTTGAGDAFNGGFVMALAQGADIFEAARYGNVCGTLSVTKQGAAASAPYRQEILKLYEENYG
ncbi:ribokinase [Anaerotruncus sp. AF02-27]|uniref:ribokinase n=1 Tax=Anaerotruncus TaxID=244127 RepID=UPI000E50DFB9|nr:MULTISPECIES: ribokinase [Anaerotruncus]RGX54743.1 ribokinase [Anaerotruncus sp. AF02-27]